MPSDFTREDYEHAARAAGLTIRWLSGKAWLHTESGVIPWAPPDDDGDTFRLAIKARISLIHEEEYLGGPVLETLEATGPLREDGSRYCVSAALNHYCTDPMAEVRHAIFSAAIEIGKSMKGTP